MATPTQPTQLGIITNYYGDILNERNIINPTLIKLNKWYGLTNTKGPLESENDLVTDIDGTTTNPERLNNYFKGKFDNFDKISKDTPGDIELEPPFKDVFDVKSLIIIYLEAKKTNEKWNTTNSSDNRIYLFDNDGNEVRTRATQNNDNDNKSKFYEIKIVNNDLILIKDGIEVKFSFVEAAMTLAKLISELLGTEITYDKLSPDRTVTRTPGTPTRGNTPAAAAGPATSTTPDASTTSDATEPVTRPDVNAAEPAVYTTRSQSEPSVRPVQEQEENTRGRRQRRPRRSQDTSDLKKPNAQGIGDVGKNPPSPRENNFMVGDDGDDDDNNNNNLNLVPPQQNPIVAPGDRTSVTGGKKTRKRRNRKTKKNKGGKKSRKQRKSMRKMKRSSSKK